MSDGPLSPEEVAHRGFPTTFRGFDTNEVRSYLQRVANELRASIGRERELHRRVADADHRAANPVIDSETLTRALGEEMGRILASAQEAATELKSRAEENAARILREAHEQAQRIRAQAEGILADRSEEAETEAAEIRRAAAAEAAGVLERARREAAGATADVEVKTRQLVQEAQATRARIISDLIRRRRAMMTQVEQLRAGRERLLDAYRMVRRTTDEVADELRRVEAEAREAAAGVPDPTAGDAEPAEELDDVLTAFPERTQNNSHEDGGEPEARRSDAGGPAAEPVGGINRTFMPGEAGEATMAAADERKPVTVEAAAAELATGPETGSASPAATSGSAPEGERRSPALHLLRRPRADARAGQLEVVDEPPEGEGVRVITPAQTPAPAGKGGEEGEPGDRGESGGQAPGVDELFARIRAGRADAVAKAHEVLAAEPEATAGPADEPAGEPVAASAEPAAVAGGEIAGEEGLLQRRDRALEGIETRLARKLKRALQDEQNEVLDRLRSSKSGADAAVVLPPPADQTRRYRDAAEEVVAAAAAAGAEFASPGSGARPEVVDVADEVASSLAEPLRRTLERAFVGEAGTDHTAVVERIGAAYRECKAQRIEGLAGDAVTAAFSRGALAALPQGVAARWIVDDGGRPCPDCDDNALAGLTPAGESFPTGQPHPPAHAGCRCLLAPAELSAAVNGSA